MKEAGRQRNGAAALPQVRMAPMCAAGPSGERQEHLDDIIKFAGISQRRRLFRAIDELTVRWAIGDLPGTCRWLLNTQVMFLQKVREPHCKIFDDEEWVATLCVDDSDDDVDVDGMVDDIPESAVSDLPPPTETQAADGRTGVGGETRDASAKVRPIQMGEFMRKYVSRRLNVLSDTDIERVMIAMRQLGVRTSGGAEALAIFHQVVYEVWQAGLLTKPVARIKVDEKNCFGSLEWDSVRKAALEAHPKHAAVAAWKHAAVSYVEQEGVPPQPKDRGAEQGDVDGPKECALTLGLVARNARSMIHQQQRAGDLPWTCDGAEELNAAQADFDNRSLATRTFQEQALGCVVDPRHEIQKSGGLADFWYLDDGDILCSPLLVKPFLIAFDRVNPVVGAERSCSKTEVTYYCTEEELEVNAGPWRLGDIRSMASVGTAAKGSVTLGVATGPDEFVEEQMQQKIQVLKAMYERTQVCADPQTEFVLARQSLGVSRVNHILRVHGSRLSEVGSATGSFDDLGKATLDRLFPGITPTGHVQASLSSRHSGLSWKQASEVARSAHLGALTATKPLVLSMIADMAKAGLCEYAVLESRLEGMLATATHSYLGTLAEVEKVRAENFLQRAQSAAQEDWVRATSGRNGMAPIVPRVLLDASYTDSDTQNDGDDQAPRGRRGRTTAVHLQRELAALRDRTRLRNLEETLASQGHWAQLDRVKELQHADVSHKWLNHLDTRSGGVLAASDFVINVQKRLGAVSLASALSCRLCGAELDPQLEHSETCCVAEATRGHYACVRAVVNGLKLADPSVTTEPRGLTTLTSRPADIFTTAAVPGRSAALDVCIASPNAAAAAGDAAQAAFSRKLRRYRSEIRELRSAGIVFRPLVWTADGRPHPAVTRTLKYAAEIASTRNNQQSSASSLVSRWRHEIQVAILRRRAAMYRAVLPKATASERWLLTGSADRGEYGLGREEVIEEDAQEECTDWSGAEDTDAPPTAASPPPARRG